MDAFNELNANKVFVALIISVKIMVTINMNKPKYRVCPMRVLYRARLYCRPSSTTFVFDRLMRSSLIAGGQYLAAVS